jgi:hypothetical protein
MSLNDQELRLECLRLAEKNSGTDTQQEAIVEKATAFYVFLTSQHQKIEAIEQMVTLVASLNHQSSDLLIGLDKQRIELRQKYPDTAREFQADKQPQ